MRRTSRRRSVEDAGCRYGSSCVASAEAGRSGMTASAASLTRRVMAGPTSAPAASIRSCSHDDGCAGSSARRSETGGGHGRRPAPQIHTHWFPADEHLLANAHHINSMLQAEREEVACDAHEAIKQFPQAIR